MDNKSKKEKTVTKSKSTLSKGLNGSWLTCRFDGAKLVLPIDDLVFKVDGGFIEQKAFQVIGGGRQDRVGHDAHDLQALVDQDVEAQAIQGHGLKKTSLLNHIAKGHARAWRTVDREGHQGRAWGPQVGDDVDCNGVCTRLGRAVAIQDAGCVGAQDQIVSNGNRGGVGQPSNRALELHASKKLGAQGGRVIGQLDLCCGENP